MTTVPEATTAAIPLAHAAVCIDCDVVVDIRAFTDQRLPTCRGHLWVRLSRWIPPMPEGEEVKP